MSYFTKGEFYGRSAIPLLLIALMGCSHFGPNTIRNSRTDYNIAIEQTSNEQLLLNLVRLRYRDTPFFMETASISTNFSFDGGIGATADIVPSAADNYGLFSNLNYSENPTITYIPLQGEKFVKQMLTPLRLEILLLLYHSGWSIDRLMRITAQSINGIPNAPTASGPTPDTAPEYEHFNEISALIRSLQKSRSIVLAADAEGGLVLNIKPESHKSSDVQTFLQALNLDGNTLSFPITSSLIMDSKRISIIPRSLMASMFYLSQTVDVSQYDRDAGKVTITKYESGEVFDWDNVAHNLFNINTSSSYPKSPYVAVKYRDAWFYIDDADLSSKSTFSLLKQLLALQSGDVQFQVPVLTLPVGR